MPQTFTEEELRRIADHIGHDGPFLVTANETPRVSLLRVFALTAAATVGAFFGIVLIAALIAGLNASAWLTITTP